MLIHQHNKTAQVLARGSAGERAIAQVILIPVALASTKLCTKSSESHPRKWVDASDPFYQACSDVRSKIPSTAVGGLFRLASGNTEPLESPEFSYSPLSRKDLNHLPTAVGGILNFLCKALQRPGRCYQMGQRAIRKSCLHTVDIGPTSTYHHSVTSLPVKSVTEKLFDLVMRS